ncbi:hypothetical protein TEA_028549 [Camellia sinensis var. sinensis]|uniref:LSM domain-containing protein n=1 Tax=Camellia sinensis var. sinensis TaxID=542762 RepID=A0A4S4DGR2_CAMSN|nr:hypothetical protein TEA_028549 [Camellia sinensis var. sinensis]
MTSVASPISSDDPEQWCLGPAPNPGIQIDSVTIGSSKMETEQEAQTSLNQAGSSDGSNLNGSNLVARVKKLLFRQMLVGISDGRFFVGTFYCIDKQGNIILQDALEYRSALALPLPPWNSVASVSFSSPFLAEHHVMLVAPLKNKFHYYH